MLLIFLFNILTVPAIMSRTFDFMGKYNSTYKSCAHCNYYFYLPPPMPTPPTLMYKVKITYTQRTPGYLPPETPHEKPTPTPVSTPVPGIKQSTVQQSKARSTTTTEAPSSRITTTPTTQITTKTTPITTEPTTLKTTGTTQAPVATDTTTAFTPMSTTPRTTPMFTTPKTIEATPDISGVVDVKLPIDQTETKSNDKPVDISSSVVVKIPNGLSPTTENPSIPTNPPTNVIADINGVVHIKVPDIDLDQDPITGRKDDTSVEPVIAGRDIDYSYVDSFSTLTDEILSR